MGRLSLRKYVKLMLPEFDPDPNIQPGIVTTLEFTSEPDLSALLRQQEARIRKMEQERERLKPRVLLNTRLAIVGLIMGFVVSLSLIPKDTLDEYQERLKQAGQVGIGLVTIWNLVYESLKTGSKPKRDDSEGSNADSGSEDRGADTTDANL